MKKTFNLILVCIISCLLFGLPACQDLPRQNQKETNHFSFSEGRLDHFGLTLHSLPEGERAARVEEFIQENPYTPLIETDTVAGIYWYGTAIQVMLNGDMQEGWSAPDTMNRVPCGEKEFFYLSFVLPRDARVDYVFYIDSEEVTDPHNPVITPSGYGPHSQIAMPGFVSSPARKYYPEVPHGSIDSLFFTSRDEEVKSRPVKVYLPAGYDSLSNMPVLYVVDGLEALVYMDYSNVLDNLIAWKEIRPVIAVFVPPVDRGNEFMETGKKGFLDMICDQMVPWVDSLYSTDPRPASRGISGISAGGYFALMAVLTRNDVISCGAGQSASIKPEVQSTVRYLVENGKYNTAMRIYFDVGRFDLPKGLLGTTSFLQKAEELDVEMNRLKVEHKFLVVNDGHEWANWRERTGEILKYFFKL